MIPDPEVIPDPEAILADPEVIPADPGVIPADPEVIPADPEVIPADPEAVPSVPEATSSVRRRWTVLDAPSAGASRAAEACPPGDSALQDDCRDCRLQSADGTHPDQTAATVTGRPRPAARRQPRRVAGVPAAALAGTRHPRETHLSLSAGRAGRSACHTWPQKLRPAGQSTWLGRQRAAAYMTSYVTDSAPSDPARVLIPPAEPSEGRSECESLQLAPVNTVGAQPRAQAKTRL